MLHWPRTARIASAVLLTRALAWIAMVIGSHWPVRDDALHWNGNDGAFFWDQVPYRWLDVWGRWDTMFYLQIARGGYPPAPPEGWAYTAAYFPLFPSLMRGTSELLFGLDPYYCGLLVANALLVGAVVYLDKLVRLDETPQFAVLVLCCLMAYPGSHWLSCVYPESTALFLGVFAIYNVRTHRPLIAGLACMLAVITRSSGAIICLAVLYELLRGDDGKLRPRARMWVLLLPLLTIGFWLALNLSVYGDPLYFAHVQAGWGRRPSFPLEPLFNFELTADHHVFTLFSLLVVAFGLRSKKERGAYRLMGTVNALLPLSTGLLRGVHRYMASNFPIFIFLARFLEQRPRWRTAYFGVGLTVLAIFSFRWGQGRWPN